MLGHLGTRSSRHKHGRGGDIECVGTIAARAAEVYEVGNVIEVHGHRCGELAHHLGSRGNLNHRFALDPQGQQERRQGGGGHLASHDLPHHREHLLSR